MLDRIKTGGNDPQYLCDPISVDRFPPVSIEVIARGNYYNSPYFLDLDNTKVIPDTGHGISST